MYGWAGKIVTVDLTLDRIREEKSNLNLLSSFIGGRGLGVKLYYDSVHYNVHPLSPENPLIFCTGPLTGLSPMSGRHAMVSRSPLTGTIFDSSSGGFFGKELKFAGIDALIIKGRAEQPVYISINNEEIDIKRANNLWGMNTRECTTKLSSEGKVACIGRAGEKQVAIANVMNDYTHACGRGGLGAVMGSKLLKAVVVKGDIKPKVKDEEGFNKACEDVIHILKIKQMKGLSTYGTSSILSLLNYLKILPTKNFQKSEFEYADRVSGEFIKKNYDIKNKACYNCIIACKHVIKSGAMKEYEVPEYETIWAFGPDNNNADMDEIIRVNRLCNDYGIDTISSGSTIAAYAEINENEYKLTELVEKIGERQGIGVELGRGSKALASLYKKDIAMHSKGLELPGYDPRGVLGQALAYATSNRGGCHLRAYMIALEVLGKPEKIQRLSFSGKAELVMKLQNCMAGLDSLIVCKFAYFVISEKEFVSMLSTVTGIDYSIDEFLKCGERIWNLERLLNVKAGFGRKDDSLPDRFFEGEGINREEFEKALTQYYRLRGWSVEGIPTKEKLNELGLL